MIIPTYCRFSCLSREYRYLFWRGTLDILVCIRPSCMLFHPLLDSSLAATNSSFFYFDDQAMQKAAEKFIGEHDFRNFCKMDAANVKNYKRRITKFYISPCNQRYSIVYYMEIVINCLTSTSG